METRLNKICSQFRAKLRRLLLEYGILRTSFFCLVVALGLVLLDWRFRFSPDMRCLSLGILLIVACLCYYFDFHRPLRRTWDDEQILEYMDRTRPDGQDVLLTFRDLSNPEGMREWETDVGKQIINSTLTDLETRVQQVSVKEALRDRPVRLWRKFVIVIAVVYLVGFIVPRHPQAGSYLAIGLKRLLLPYASVFWPQKTRIFVVEPESGWRVPKGEQFIVKAKIDGEVPDIVNIVYKSKSSAMWITERMAVNRQASEASFKFQEMLEPLTFYCIGGDDYEKRTYSVSVADRPMITHVKAIYTFPIYTMLPKRISSTGQLTGIEGTDVQLEFTASMNLSKAVMKFELEGEEPRLVEITDIHRNKFSHKLMLTKSGNYSIELTGANELKSGRLERYDIRVEPDNPPEIIIEQPVRDQIMTANGKVRVKFKAKDDYNLTDLNVMLGAAGEQGKPLSDRITGRFWQSTTTLHPVGEGDFYLDFLAETEKGTLKGWKIEPGAELDLWIRAVDCNPNKPGISESIKIRLSILHPTDFMEAIVLKTKELMGDTRVGWHSLAGAYHDGKKWLSNQADDKLLQALQEQQETAERSAAALGLRYPEIIEAMDSNRLRQEFMAKRLNDIGTKINELKEFTAAIGKKLAEGRPVSQEEAQPERRRAKMAKALNAVLAEQNKAAWRMRLLYDRIADWVALQSVFLKTKRIEEMQTLVNKRTEALVKKTLGREARELDDDEVREMKEVGNQQQTVHDMEEAVEKELTGLIGQADRDGRKKIVELLGSALLDLSNNQIKKKLQLAALAILDGRGETVRNDQKLVLEIIAILNRGLIKAGEEVPPEPPASQYAMIIDDPRGKVEEVSEIKGPGETIDAEIYKTLERITTLREAKPDTLDDSLQKIVRFQEDIRNRTKHVAERGKVFPRYNNLRRGLLAYRQEQIVNMWQKASTQINDYGKPSESTKQPDPSLDRTKQRLARQIASYQEYAKDGVALIKANDFGEMTTGLQTHLFEGARDLRVFMQETERLHALSLERYASKFLDSFERKYLLNDTNFVAMFETGQELEWALVQEAAVRREAELLTSASQSKTVSQPAKTTMERILNYARSRNNEVVELIGKVQEKITGKVRDPTEPDRENEKVMPIISQKVLSQLDPKAFQEAVAEFARSNYGIAAQRFETLRGTISGILVSLKDMFQEVVPPKKEIDHLAGIKLEEVIEEGRFIDYMDELPSVIADLIEKEGEWIDIRTGNSEVRKRIVKRLREIGHWDPRYSRLQSAYFHAVAQNFQVKAKKEKESDKITKQPKKP